MLDGNGPPFRPLYSGVGLVRGREGYTGRKCVGDGIAVPAACFPVRRHRRATAAISGLPDYETT